VYLFVDPEFPCPLIFLRSGRVSSTHRMDAPDRHNGQTDIKYADNMAPHNMATRSPQCVLLPHVAYEYHGSVTITT